MDSQMDEILCCGAGQAICLLLKAAGICGRQHRRKVHPYLQERKLKGRFAKDFEDLVQCQKKFKENFHMEYESFQAIFSLVEGYLQPKRHTHPQNAISPKEKLAIVLEYFACGTLQRHIASVYRISKQHFGQVLSEVCDAIIGALHNEIPTLCKEELLKTAKSFEKWNFPNCVGAIDGKHCAVKCPPKSGSLFYNYKSFFSIVLMGVANGDYQFTYIDVGAYGSEGDANVFHKSSLGRALSNGTLQFPNDSEIFENIFPYVFVGDDAFPLHHRMMKPFTPARGKKLEDAQQIFNYRLSRARRCIENAFGILCSKFYCLSRKMYCHPDKARKIVTACCYLHNFLIRTRKEQYCPPSYVDRYNDFGEIIRGDLHNNLPSDSLFTSDLHSTQTGRHSNSAKDIREKLKMFFNSDAGSIPWQRKATYLE